MKPFPAPMPALLSCLRRSDVGMTPASYPIQLRLQGRAVLVAGAGAVAARKLERLLTCGGRVRVIATHVSDAVRRLGQTHEFAIEERAFRDEDVYGMFLVIAGTNESATNEHIALLARAAGSLVLRVDAPESSDFTLPAWTHTDHVAVTISTHGKAPAASRRLARELSAWLLRGPERFASEIARARTLLGFRVDNASRLRALSDGPLLEACGAQDEARIAELVTASLEAP